MYKVVMLANFAGHGKAIAFLLVAGLIVLLTLAACFIGSFTSGPDR
jgi:hypothetical protein